MTKGQRAMAVAMIYPEPKRGVHSQSRKVTAEFSKMHLSRARTVLRHLPDEASLVLSGAMSLDVQRNAAPLAISVGKGFHVRRTQGVRIQQVKTEAERRARGEEIMARFAASHEPSSGDSFGVIEAARRRWENDPDIRVEFGDSFERYLGFYKADRKGLVKILAPGRRG